jgi:hypothetical protein
VRLSNFFVEILNFRNDDKGAKFELNVSMKSPTTRGRHGCPTAGPSGSTRSSGLSSATLISRPRPPIRPAPDGRHHHRRRSQPEHRPALRRMAGPPVHRPVRRWLHHVRRRRPDLEHADQGEPDAGPRHLNHQAFTPSVHVLPDGTVGVSYYDFRNNTAGGGTDTDYSWCTATPRAATRRAG